MPALIGSPFYASVDELFQDRGGIAWQADGPRVYQRQFRVVVKLKLMQEIAVCAAPGIPLPYSPYISGSGVEYDLLALCTELSAKPEYSDDWQNWIVTAKYSTQMPRGGKPSNPGFPSKPDGAANNPELEPPDIEWDFETVQITPMHDLKGKPVWNSAFRPFSPAPTISAACAVLRMTRNELSFDLNKATGYAYATNSDQFLIAKPGQAQCQPPKAKMIFRGPTRYWRVSYAIRFGYWQGDFGVDEQDPGTVIRTPDEALISPGMRYWEPTRILDAGYEEYLQVRRSSDNALVWAHKHILTSDGQRVSHPVPLLAGRKLPPDDPVTGDIKRPAYMKFHFYKPLPFNTLLVNGLA